MIDEKEFLTEEEARWLLNFATSLNDGVMNVGNIFTPSLLNQNLKNLNNHPYVPDYESINKALSDALNSGEALQGYQEWMELAEMTFKRTLEYYSTMLSFDLSYTCLNIYDKEDYNKQRYKKDKAIVEEFLTKFNYKKEFQKVVKQMLRSETAFMWFRNNENKKDPVYTLQLMPQRHCLITGAWEKGLLYDFNMNYFLQPGVDINGYDPIFKEFNKEIYEGEKYSDYKPTNVFDKRDGTFAYWVQTSPLYMHDGLPSGAWAFKRDESTYTNIPYLSAMMRDAILNIPVKKLQHDKDALSAYAYLIGEIGMLKTNEANATQFDPVRLGTLLNIVKQAIGKHIVVGAMPANEVKWHQYVDQNETMADNQVKLSMASGAGASRILYASDKMSQEEIRNAILADYNVMKPLYEQFNNFLDFYVNQLTKKYKFKFMFNGSNYCFEREWRKDGIMKLADKGIVLNETAFASAYGFHPVMFGKMLQETSAEGSWKDNLSNLQSVYTTSNVGTGTNRSNYNTDDTEYIHTGRPGRPRKAENQTNNTGNENSSRQE